MAPFESREQLVRRLATASLTGTLGLFVGSGFSMALTLGAAPDWGHLLQKVAKGLGLPDPLGVPRHGVSFPRLATEMVNAMALRSTGALPLDKRRAVAEHLLKVEVSRQLAIFADPTTLQRFHAVLDPLAPAWVATTNYDYLAERCFQHSETLSSNQVVRIRRGMTPVFHIHGSIIFPDTIVLTEEDYVATLSGTGYWHTRLSMLFAESTTLMLGYALGDINIQTAMRYASSYASPSQEMRPSDIGQVVFLNRPQLPVVPEIDPRSGIWGETIVDSAEIVLFLEEILGARRAIEAEWSTVKTLASGFSSNPASAIGFVNGGKWRNAFIAFAQQIPAMLGTTEMASFLMILVGSVSKEARQTAGAWDRYTVWMEVVLDVLEQWPIGLFPPDLFECFAHELSQLAAYIDPPGARNLGTPWDASELWHARKHRIFQERRELLKALGSYAERTRSDKLWSILDGL